MQISAIYTSESAGEPMQRRDRIRAVEGGLEGDRYCTGSGHYSPFDVCEVTFIERDVLETIAANTGIDLSDGQHRRNIVVSGDLGELLGCRFTAGAATFEATRRRPPCRYLEELTGEDGLMRALGDDRGGICARVAEPGAVAEGDEIEVCAELSNFEGLVASIRERVGQ